MRAAEILGGSDEAHEKVRLLIQGHAGMIYIYNKAGSYKEASDQLITLANAADSMIVAFKNLGGAAFQSLSDENPVVADLYQRKDLSVLAKLCREKSRLFATEASSGTHTAAKFFNIYRESPVQMLTKHCAIFIEYFYGDLNRTIELARIVEEIVTSVKPKPRWAERECREAKRFAQTLPKVAQSSV